ncbi:amino acid racemase [Fulvivirgaceae bacterium BMA10]|uniref:Amino acid racemase n=1 Tax=Splendidivirga corallicola TaxID=3051826 RepID=A0ABT8KUZ3_9BACT|nr:amino acid racemase [Fulvivirgaceae bacterium BMA10]
MKKMRILGLIGGTSWHSTVEYYASINQSVNEYFGDNTNPPLLLFNLNQSLVHKYQRDGEWEKIAHLVIDGGKRLQKAGAEAIIFCANTPHKIFEIAEGELNIPILHIADATSKMILESGIEKVCFLGTKFSMEEDFVTGRISKNNIKVLTPTDHFVIEELHRIIQKELTFGKVVPSSKSFVLESIKTMTDLGAEGVVLGCTEFPLMIREEDLDFPIFNTTKIHSKAATEYILNIADNFN